MGAPTHKDPSVLFPASSCIAAPPSTPAAHLERREFLTLAAGCLWCGTAGISPARAATDRPIDIGVLQDYPRDEISEKFIQHDIFVIRHRGKLFACTAVCPHKANYLLLDPQHRDRIICSGHDSKFTPDGIPAGGPTRRALVRYAIAANDKVRLMVDTSREFPQAQWDDKASFLTLPS
jgi:nitrite reductase/ring-hydroxylating ferredoxin subunit